MFDEQRGQRPVVCGLGVLGSTIGKAFRVSIDVVLSLRRPRQIRGSETHALEARG